MRKILPALISIVTMIAGPANAQEQSQFDLLCRSSSGAETRYRVDLVRGEACRDECERIWKTGEVTTGQIKLIDTVPNLPGDLEERMTVNRQTGSFEHYAVIPGLGRNEITGICQVARFTGFPGSMF